MSQRPNPALAVVMVVLAGCGGTVTSTDLPSSPQSSETPAPPTPRSTPTPARASASSSVEATPVGDAELMVDWTIPFTMTAPAEWEVGDAATVNAVDLVDGTGLRTVLAVIRKTPDAPEEWVDRLTTADALEATEAEAIEIDGASGVVFDVRLRDGLPACTVGGSSGGIACFPIHGPEDGWYWILEENRPSRIWVLNVSGDTVVMSSDARDDRFEAWKTVIDEAVSTIRWAGE